MDEGVEPHQPIHLVGPLAGLRQGLPGHFIHDVAGVQRSFWNFSRHFGVPDVAADMAQQLGIVLLQEFAHDILEFLRAGAFGHRLGSEACSLQLAQLLATFLAFPEPSLAADRPLAIAARAGAL